MNKQPERTKLKKPCHCGSTDNPHTCFGFEPKNQPERSVEEIVEASQCDAGDVVTGWVIQSDEVRNILQAERQRRDEMVEAEAYRWFNMWYAFTIDKKESIDGFYGFGQFAVHRLQEIGASDTQPTTPLTNDKK